jgi:ubiquinone/menaquinone biosynthesis C-methylase UbiE
MKLLKEEFQGKVKKNFINLINEKQLINDFHYEKTINLWGKNNHKKNKTKHIAEDTHIEKVLIEYPLEDSIDNYLEIGCGEGIDVNYLQNNYKIKNTYVVDIGENIFQLSKLDKFQGVNFCRCDCLSLPFNKSSFDVIYSYGVFHHTPSLKLSIEEAKKVLKKDGVLIFYNYIKHKNLFKRCGIYIETILLKLFQNKSYSNTKFFCYLMTPFILLFFSYPAQFLKLLGSKKMYKKFPLWWGLKPNDIILDLLDRLYAPINVRLTKYEMVKLLNDISFSHIEVREVPDGLFCKAVK